MGAVLVGVDGSNASAVALRWAGWFAAATARPLHVAHAWQRGGVLDGVADASDPEAIEAAVEVRLRELAAEELGTDIAPTVVRALRGEVVEALSKEAARIGADVVVVGARGSGGALRSLLGSVSRELTECPTRAVVVVPETDDEALPGVDWSMLVAVDGSAGSSRAVRWTAANAARAGSSVVAVHAYEPPVADLYEAETESLVAEASERLDVEWCAPLRTRDVPYRPVVVPGEARTVLSVAVEDLRPDLVVVGSRGLGAFSSKLLGSVADHLVRTLERPVVLIPSPRDCVTWTV